MDKYEYKIRSEEIKELIAQKEYVEAAEIADTIDWRRVKSVMMLCTISDLYKINRRFEDSRNLLLLAYDRHPGGRSIVYSLCELSIKMGDFVMAVEYYKEFVQVAPKDSGRYILQYKLYEAQDVSLEERIAVLEELKARDYTEKWAYELAYLYHRIGLGINCRRRVVKYQHARLFEKRSRDTESLLLTARHIRAFPRFLSTEIIWIKRVEPYAFPCRKIRSPTLQVFRTSYIKNPTISSSSYRSTRGWYGLTIFTTERTPCSSSLTKNRLPTLPLETEALCWARAVSFIPCTVAPANTNP